MSKDMHDKIERWLIHENFSFKEIKEDDNVYHFLIRHAGESGAPVEIFEPKTQPNVLVIGSKINLKNNQIARYLQLSKPEKEKFEKKIADFCYSIQAIHRFLEEYGKRKVGVYFVFDDQKKIDQQTIFEKIDAVARMHEKTTNFLLKSF